MPDIAMELDRLIRDTETCDEALLPDRLVADINAWKWGGYGWTSPVSLIITAAWRKHYYPDADCCRIWARDEKNYEIPGGYSIRTMDENITIPLLSKYDLCQDFCSGNSGMQGSRAIEKMRSLGRIREDIAPPQRTVFDYRLFARILNGINALEPPQSWELLKLLIVIAKRKRRERIGSNEALEAGGFSFSLPTFLKQTHDPELTKCVAAACLRLLYHPAGLTLSGVEDYKTAADARANKPGDLCLSRNDIPIAAVEVKDKTQTINWSNVRRAIKILEEHPTLGSFLFVLEKPGATRSQEVVNILESKELGSGNGAKITVLSLSDLRRLALLSADEAILLDQAGRYLAMAPAVKPETKQSWIGCQEKAGAPE